MIDKKNVVIVVEVDNLQYTMSILNELKKCEYADEIRFLIKNRNFLKTDYLLNFDQKDKKVLILEDHLHTHILKQCKKNNTIYVVMSGLVFWASKNSISNLIESHLNHKSHFLSFMTLAASDFSGYLMQVMGLLPDVLIHRWHADYIFSYKLDHPAMIQELHEKIIFLSETNSLDTINYGRWLFDNYYDYYCGAFCFDGNLMKSNLFFIKTSKINNIEELVSQVSEVALSDPSKKNAIIGNAWCAADEPKTSEFKNRYLLIGGQT